MKQQKIDGLVLREKLEQHREETIKKEQEKEQQNATIREEQLKLDYLKLDNWYENKILPSIQKYGQFLLHVPSFNDYFGTALSFLEMQTYFNLIKGYDVSSSVDSGYDLVISIEGLASFADNPFESELPTTTGKNGYHEYKALLPNINEESV
ncbi:hypothetical protein Q5427_10860 [Brochothrix thermosphacta]|uniref:hypothetical protein n=1 Tax=Brochothrix thermosphacta TaxID=2756 RepID=UPI0027140157|nr:hypothetical protein [Brochothrix thermosphacta]MDO7864790.1 hypothetical protein [Brochothrix thermosphacta]